MSGFVRLLLLGVMVGSFVWLESCRRKESLSPRDIERLREAAEDAAIAEGEANHIGNVVDNQGENARSRRLAGVDSTFLPPCAEVSYDSSRRRLLIDFGDTNCLCRDGVYRRGKIIVDFSGAQWWQRGSRAYITTQNFFVNDNQHLVEKILFHEGINAAGERIIRDTVVSHRVITPEGSLEWRAQRTYRQTQGQNTWQRWDDVWLIEGGAQGTSRRGNDFTTQIQEPLKVVGSCIFPHPVKGIWQLRTAEHTVTLDYDPYRNEACDRVASIKVNDRNPVNITLR